MGGVAATVNKVVDEIKDAHTDPLGTAEDGARAVIDSQTDIPHVARNTHNEAGERILQYGSDLDRSKGGDYVRDLGEDAGRVGAAALTSGQSEVIRGSGIEIDLKMKEEAERNAPKGAPPPVAPTPGDKKEPISEVAEEQKRARGRASTILTGRRGLSGSPTTARRTLLGV